MGGGGWTKGPSEIGGTTMYFSCWISTAGELKTLMCHFLFISPHTMGWAWHWMWKHSAWETSRRSPLYWLVFKIWSPCSKSSVLNSSLERLCQTSTWKLGLWSWEERLLSLVVFPEPLPSCKILWTLFYLPSPLLVGRNFPPVMKSTNNPLEFTSLGTRSIRSVWSSHEYSGSIIETPFRYGTPSTLMREERN